MRSLTSLITGRISSGSVAPVSWSVCWVWANATIATSLMTAPRRARRWGRTSGCSTLTPYARSPAPRPP
ncbi:DUF6882 domain-containing protein [Nonomuraea sp. NPDC049695]|uniref:DUF6882 domain-containing protein n=1 Tax=Nonomuraea sp. NPDC049695 TaxID=3154734 RepID=UPI003429C199